MPAASSDLRKELNGAEEDGPEHDARIFGEVTDLFLSNVGRLGDSQIAAVDGVLAHLVERVDATTVIQLSEALSTIDRAPRQTVRKLAFHEQSQVAAPVLRSSSCLSDADLLEIVKSRSQQHLLAICDRKTLNEALTDALMQIWRRQRLQRARPEHGRAFLRMRLRDAGGAGGEGRGAGGKARRSPGHSRQPAAGADWQGCRRRSRALPDGAATCRARENPKSAAAAGQNGAARKAIDYTQAQNEVVALNRTGKLNDSIVNRFAVRGEYTHVVAALALKADVKVEAIEPLLDPDRVYGLIVACKAARLSWSTTTMIVRNRPNCPPSTDRELEQCVAVYESLLLSVAQWTIRWGSDRILGKKSAPAAAPTAGKKVSQPA